MGEGGGYWLNKGPFSVFLVDEPESLLSSRHGTGLVGFVQNGFPNHVADPVANLAEKFDDIGSKGVDIEGERANFGYVCAQ